MNSNLVYAPGLLTRCDEEGVPCLIQAIWYREADRAFEVLFFNGQTRFYSHEELLPVDSWMDFSEKYPTHEQFVIVEEVIKATAADYYPVMFRTLLRRAAPMFRRM